MSETQATSSTVAAPSSAIAFDVKEFTESTLDHFAKLKTFFPSECGSSKFGHKPNPQITEYLTQYVWTAQNELDFWNLVRLARHVKCSYLEFVLMRFLQDQLKPTRNHFSVQETMALFPSNTQATAPMDIVKEPTH